MLLRLLAVAYILAVAALVAAAVAIANTYCEGFGCIGLGILWFAWLVAYGVALVPGLALYRWPASRPFLARSSRVALVGQLLLGVVLAGIWAAKKLSG
ncbi:MAG: hypothetical protein HYU78_17750 [Rhodocyclales bacterium]|nr:hypothetical protein [Rhodocyclales bacterium]